MQHRMTLTTALLLLLAGVLGAPAAGVSLYDEGFTGEQLPSQQAKQQVWCT